MLARLWFGCASLISELEKTAYFFTKHHILVQILVPYYLAESSENTVFPWNLYLHKAYIVRKVFNQPNIQRSSQEQVVQPNQTDMHMCARKKNRGEAKICRNTIPQCRFGQFTAKPDSNIKAVETLGRDSFLSRL